MYINDYCKQHGEKKTSMGHNDPPICTICQEPVNERDELYISPCAMPNTQKPPHCFHWTCVRDYAQSQMMEALWFDEKNKNDKIVKCHNKHVPSCPNCRQGRLTAIVRENDKVVVYLMNAEHSLMPIIQVSDRCERPSICQKRYRSRVVC